MGNLFNSYMEKLAEMQTQSMDELELIRRAQAGDKIAMKQLKQLFAGAINDGIKRANIATPNIPQDSLRSAAARQFVKSIMTYNPAAGTKPSTWIIGNISDDLKKLDTEYKNETRLSASNTYLLSKIESAINSLKSDGIEDPDNEAIRFKIKENFGKDISIPDIDSVMKRRRLEYSANEIMGNAGTGENLSFGDVMNTGAYTGEDYMKAFNDAEKLNGALSKLDPLDKDMYEQYRGLGQHKANGPMKLPVFAKNNNFQSEYFANKKIKDIETNLKGLIEND